MTFPPSIQSIVDALEAQMNRSSGCIGSNSIDHVTVYELEPPFSQYPADIILGFSNPTKLPTHMVIEIVSPEGSSTLRHTTWLTVDDIIVPALMGVTMLPMVAMPDGWSLKVGVSGRVTAVCAHLGDNIVMEAALSTFKLPESMAYPNPVACTKPFVSSMLARSDRLTEKVVQLPDLDRTLELGVRSSRARARQALRHEAIFQELMERAWAPSRVQAGVADLDS